jgi:hypothetical protein
MKYIVFENETLLGRGLAAAIGQTGETEEPEATAAASADELKRPETGAPDGFGEPHIFRFRSNMPLEEVEEELRALLPKK